MEKTMTKTTEKVCLKEESQLWGEISVKSETTWLLGHVSTYEQQKCASTTDWWTCAPWKVCWWPLLENIYRRIEKCYWERRSSLQHSQLNPINNFQLFPKIFGETNKLPINWYLILPDRNHARPHPPSHRLWRRRRKQSFNYQNLLWQ